MLIYRDGDGDWAEKLEFKCAFGHTFSASPKLVLEEDISALNVNVKAGITKNALNVNRFSPKCGALFKARMMDENIKKLYLN